MLPKQKGPSSETLEHYFINPAKKKRKKFWSPRGISQKMQKEDICGEKETGNARIYTAQKLCISKDEWDQENVHQQSSSSNSSVESLSL